MAKKKKVTSTGFSLKDELFNRERVDYLASLFYESDQSFDAAGFKRTVMASLLERELKERIIHIANCLEDFLPENFSASCRAMIAALPPPLDPSKTDDDFGDFIFAPLGEFVARHGTAPKHFKSSLRTLHAITQRFSMEDAIRRFIDADAERTFRTLNLWVTDSNYHVRRLVSEGTRPRLPWSGRLSIDVTEPVELLDTLHADPTRYVTRSVSNHLNDIAKTHPDLVLKTLRRWRKAGAQNGEELQWMSGHALRTLVKQGDDKSLRFLGFRPNAEISISTIKLSKTSVQAGDAIQFDFDIKAFRKESLMIDYVIEFVKANGTHSAKVHKIKQVVLAKGEELSVRKRHPFRANATTFTLYPGTHYLSIQINGKAMGRTAFELKI